MLFMVFVEADWEVANKLDSQPQGPGALFQHIAEKYKPQAFYVAIEQRAAYLVVDFNNEDEMMEFVHFCIWNFGSYPSYTPVMTGEIAAGIIPKAAKYAQQFSGK